MRAGWLAVLGMVAASGAMAQSRVEIRESFENNNGSSRGSYSDRGDGKQANTHQLTSGPNLVIDASGDLSSGILRSGLILPSSGNGGASIDLIDTFSVGNISSGQIGHLDYLFTGHLTPGEDPFGRGYGLANARMGITIYYNDPLGKHPSNAWQRNLLLINSSRSSYYPCFGFNYPGQTCIRGADVNIKGTLDIPLLPGIYSVDFGLYLYAEQGWDANFTHTARTYFDLPTGVTLTSGSGVLFKTATPVPEPTSVALMLAGLGLVAGAARRRAARH